MAIIYSILLISSDKKIINKLRFPLNSEFFKTESTQRDQKSPMILLQNATEKRVRNPKCQANFCLLIIALKRWAFSPSIEAENASDLGSPRASLSCSKNSPLYQPIFFPILILNLCVVLISIQYWYNMNRRVSDFFNKSTAHFRYAH